LAASFTLERGTTENTLRKTDGTALVFGVREYFPHSFQHSHTLVTNNEPHTGQASASQPMKEIRPTGFVLLRPLSSTQNLRVSILIYRNCSQNRHIFMLSAPFPPLSIHLSILHFAACLLFFGQPAFRQAGTLEGIPKSFFAQVIPAARHF
jgi:hypothetical protein